MGKYLLKWSIDTSRVPVDPKERSDAWTLLMALIKQDMKKGIVKDWGAFPSEGRGYSIVEGSQLEMMKMTEQYVPYVYFETHPVSSVDEIDQLLKQMAG